MSKLRLMVAALFLSMVLAACNNGEEAAPEEETETTEEVEETEGTETGETEGTEGTEAEQEAPVFEDDEVVAVVNGEEILGEEFNFAYTRTQQVLEQSGQTGGTTEQVTELTLQNLIDQELLMQEAEELGITAEEAEIEESIEEVKNRFETEEDYQAELEELGISDELLREQATYNIVLQKYIESELEVPEVTDEDVQSYYEEAVGDNEEAPPLEEVEDLIREQLVQQQEREQLTTRIEELREESEIEQNI